MKPWIIGGHYIANNHKDDYILCYARTVTTIIEKWDNSEQQKKKVQEMWQQWENLCARELLQTQALCVYPCAINMVLTLFRPTKKNTGKHPGVKLIATVTFTVSSLPQGKPIKSLDNGWSPGMEYGKHIHPVIVNVQHCVPRIATLNSYSRYVWYYVTKYGYAYQASSRHHETSKKHLSSVAWTLPGVNFARPF